MSFGSVYPAAMARRAIRNDKRDLEEEKTDHSRELRQLKRDQDKLADREKKVAEREQKVAAAEKRLKLWHVKLAKDQRELDRLRDELLGKGAKAGAEPMDCGKAVEVGYEDTDDFALDDEIPSSQKEFDK